MPQKTNYYEQVLGSFCVEPNSTFCGRLHFTQKTLTKFQLWKRGKGWESYSWWFFAPHLKNMLVKSGSFSQIRGKNQKCLKPPPSSTWNAKCPICLGNFTPKTRNYCLKNRVLGFPGRYDSTFRLPWLNTGLSKHTQPGPHEAPHQHLEHPLKTGDWHADAFLVLPKTSFFPQKKNVLKSWDNLKIYGSWKSKR